MEAPAIGAAQVVRAAIGMLAQRPKHAKLSVARAQSVSRQLQSLGIAADRLVAHGFGSTLPAADNSSDDGRAKNRRVQFLVIPDVKNES